VWFVCKLCACELCLFSALFVFLRVLSCVWCVCVFCVVVYNVCVWGVFECCV